MFGLLMGLLCLYLCWSWLLPKPKWLLPESANVACPTREHHRPPDPPIDFSNVRYLVGGGRIFDLETGLLETIQSDLPFLDCEGNPIIGK